MAITTTMLFILAALAVPAAGVGNVESPVSKVVSLLGSLEAKITAEGVAAKKVFEEFSEWCEDREANLGYEIKTAEGEVADLSADIEKASADISELNSKIEDTAGSLTADGADLKAATQIRTKEQADFAAEEKEMVEIIGSLERAINILEREAAKGGASLTQLHKASSLAQVFNIMVGASMLQSRDATALTALVQSSSDDSDDSELSGAPDAAVYQSHSGSIVDTLQDLLDKAKGQLDSARNKETNAKHNFEMLKQSLEDSIKFGNQDMAEAKKNLASTQEGKAAAEGDLAVTSKTLAEDKETKSTLSQDCMAKSQDYEAATKSRAEELKALAEAKSVISGMTGDAAGLTYSSLLQIDKSELRTGADLANYEAVRFVRKLAAAQHSEALAQLARRMASAIRYGSNSGDPFAKVRGLISDMLVKLEKDADADASHKAYCDKELGDTVAKKAEKEAEISKLSTKIDAATAKSASLKSQVADLQKALAELASAQASMNQVRSEESALFATSKPEMEQGLQGVKMALKMLREYYASEEIAHEAASGAGQGIVGLLEVVESDFSKTLAELMTNEAAAAAAYDKESKANQIEKTMKEQDVKYMTKEAGVLDSAVTEATSDRESVQTELSAILDYNSQLLEMCVAKPETYSDRKGRREAEIAGLKEALSILQGEAVLLERSAQAQRQRGFRLTGRID